MNVKMKKTAGGIVDVSPFRRVFFKGDSDHVYGLGDTIYRPRLGRTLSVIAEHGPSAFYEGQLSSEICDEVHAHGGIINQVDLETYHARVKPAISVQLDNGCTVYGVPPPASSAITLLILKVMDGEWSSRASLHLLVFSSRIRSDA
jgi:gamma-glutamyltranspeptidase / glutathione hydrolase